MAQAQLYKHIRIGTEATWGTSVTTDRLLPIISTSLNANPNKQLVEDTHTSSKGRDRMVRLKLEVGGDIQAYASPKILHNFFEMALGSEGTTTAVGTSALLITYQQDATGTFASRTIAMDRNNSQEAFYGVRGSKLELKASDGLVEATLTTVARTRGVGPSVADAVGESVKPFVFADATIGIGDAAFANPYTFLASEWSLSYDNGMEVSHLSGSRSAARTDAKVPMVEGEIKIFHEGSSWVSAVYGATEKYIRIELASDSSEGLIAGITPYYMQIDIPRVELTSTERNYQQNELSVETIKFTGMFDPGTSSLIRPRLTAGFDIEV